MDPDTMEWMLNQLHDSLENIFRGKLNRRAGMVEIPTSVFVAKIDVKMNPLPPLELHRRSELDGAFEILKQANQPFSPLALSLHPVLWIREEDLPLLQRYVERQILASRSIDTTVPAGQRMEFLRQTAMTVVDDLFINPNPENIQRSTRVVGSFVYILMKEPKAYTLLTRLSSHDPYTLQHSVGTAVNSIILAKKLGITDEAELHEAGMAGLLHDIGKVRIKQEIINKNGPLDEFEWEEMRGHPEAGFEMLQDKKDITDRTKRAVLEHHEDKNGTGYPSGKREDQVELFSKIVGVCDIFNALTTERSYSKARSAFDAFQFMRDKLHHKIEESIFKELVLIYGGKV